MTPAQSFGQTEQAAPATGKDSSDPSKPSSISDHPALTEFSSMMEEFAGAETNIKISGNETSQAPTPDKLTTGSAPGTVGALRSGLGKTASESVQIPVAPKSENLVNNPPKGTIHSTQVPGSATKDVAWQKTVEPEAEGMQAPLSSPPNPVASQQLDANSQPGNPAANLQKNAVPQANGIQPSGAVSANVGESAPYADLSEASTSGQGKSGQQSGPGPGDNPAPVPTFSTNLANNPAPDSAANLLTAHTPSVPVSHANTSSSQIPPSSSEPPATLSAWQNYDGGAGKIVRSASLNDSANGAEMHVEFRAGALGPLEVHTVVREGSVGAEIHVQSQEAHTLLAAGLPSLERALGERNLRVENIAVYQDHAGGGMSGGEKQDQQPGSSPSPQRQVLPWDSPPQPSTAASGSLDGEELTNPAAGLSVRA